MIHFGPFLADGRQWVKVDAVWYLGYTDLPSYNGARFLYRRVRAWGEVCWQRHPV